ncbi:carbohydrate ABC transporter permease [Amycolatopsis rubida]|uniref:Multiple sugar transport system permease protein/sn-glycerol 3-phosphate transport system permease protein n=1 Tax=Amycolatopsis rubida TaxID=112413 RepID=A0A1I5SIA6_9PSEU|nr:carbohydrate ABC transporter permease [Amycolatopsis rubida]SFP70449.1 multiple sugar transport system permease protein/sn-glycerol 3-phosphate transport system permease protein [Amycolatopsis rubida]
MPLAVLDPSPAAGEPEPPTAERDDRPVGETSRRRALSGHAVLLVLAVFAVFPIYWMYSTSVRRASDVLDGSWLPWPLSAQSYEYVLKVLPIVKMLGNTFLVAASTSVLQLVVALLAAYAFVAWAFPGRQLLYLLLVGAWLVPFQVTMIPNYVYLSQFGLLNVLAGVVVPTVCSTMAIMLLRQHLQAFPRELLDAARMDGRSSWLTLWTVVVPNLRPALASLAILLFISAWNDYFWPALVLHRSDSVLQIGIRGFLSAEGNNWGAVMAASGIACLPIFALYLFLQRQVMDAFVRSGMR